MEETTKKILKGLGILAGVVGGAVRVKKYKPEIKAGLEKGGRLLKDGVQAVTDFVQDKEPKKSEEDTDEEEVE